jgi:hypothetical protein
MALADDRLQDFRHGDQRVGAGMTLWLQAVTFDVVDPLAAADFWGGLLERDVVPEPGGAFVPGDTTQLGLRFVACETAQVGRPRLHVHLTSESQEEQERTVQTALRLGGRHLDVGQGIDDGFVVLADPAGNELCVIEPGNAYLAGTGYLGEVTCDGTRAVGLFWHEALAWPLVWDQGAQTAIQSPAGGTKISWDSWGEPAADSEKRRNGQRFDLLSTDPASDAARLIGLGAIHLDRLSDGIGLADPDGNEFTIRRASG